SNFPVKPNQAWSRLVKPIQALFRKSFFLRLHRCHFSLVHGASLVLGRWPLELYHLRASVVQKPQISGISYRNRTATYPKTKATALNTGTMSASLGAQVCWQIPIPMQKRVFFKNGGFLAIVAVSFFPFLVSGQSTAKQILHDSRPRIMSN